MRSLGSSIVITPRLPLRVVAALSIAAALAACHRYDSILLPGDRLAFGEWGGDHVDVVANGSVTNVFLGCTSGQFPGNIPLDGNGRFSVNGSWNPSIGPIRLDGNMPAQLSGQLAGNVLTFAVAVNDTVVKQVSSLGPATVVFGRQGTGTICPV
jgi:hypothetical protein